MLGLGAVGCKKAKKSDAPAAPIAVWDAGAAAAQALAADAAPRPAAVRFAVVDGGAVLFVDVAGDSVRTAATVQIGADVVSALWRDATTLLVVDAGGKLHEVDEKKSTRLTVPPVSAWAAADVNAGYIVAGNNTDDGSNEDDGVSEEATAYPFRLELLRDRGGAIWLIHCART